MAIAVAAARWRALAAGALLPNGLPLRRHRPRHRARLAAGASSPWGWCCCTGRAGSSTSPRPRSAGWPRRPRWSSSRAGRSPTWWPPRWACAVAALTGLLDGRHRRAPPVHRPRLIVTVATIGLAQMLGAAQIFLPHLFTDLQPFTTFHAPVHLPPADRPARVRRRPPRGGAGRRSPLARSGGSWCARTSAWPCGPRPTRRSGRRSSAIPIRRLSRLTWVVAAVLSGLGAMLERADPRAPTSASPPDRWPCSCPSPPRWWRGWRTCPAPRSPRWGSACSSRRCSGATRGRRPSTWACSASCWSRCWCSGDGRAERTTTELGAFVAARQPRPLSPALAAPHRGARRRATAWRRSRPRRRSRRSSMLSDSQLIVVAYMAIYGIVAISLVVLTGWAGQISLGQFAFVAVGAGVTAGLYVNAGPRPVPGPADRDRASARPRRSSSARRPCACPA